MHISTTPQVLISHLVVPPPCDMHACAMTSRDRCSVLNGCRSSDPRSSLNVAIIFNTLQKDVRNFPGLCTIRLQFVGLRSYRLGVQVASVRVGGLP